MRVEIYNASAGSGKTFLLVGNYLCDIIWKPRLYRHILAVTFTNKATEEMKSRILREIHTLASGAESPYMRKLTEELELSEEQVRRHAQIARSAILHDYSHFTVLTIDKFFQRILHAFVKELGLELNYNVEIESSSVLARSVDALIERITEDPALKKWMEEYSAERIEENEGWDLRRDILRLGDELFKEGNRPALQSARSKEELEKLVRAAAAERNRTQRLFRETAERAVRIAAEAGLGLEDFSNGSKGGAAYLYNVAGGEIAAPGKRARECAETAEKGWFTQKRAKEFGAVAARLQPLMRELCDLYDTHQPYWNTVTLLKENYREFALLSDLYELVRRIWREENSMLLSETKNILAAFIVRNEVPFIYEKAGTRYDRYMIDEFQDTSQREWLNFLPLLREAQSHPTQLADPDDPIEQRRPAVLLVGDVKQSIYRWRGGDWRILSQGARQALEGAEVKNMTENYRSLQQVVRFNNDAIRAVVEATDARLRELLQEAPAALRQELDGTLKAAYAGHEQTPRRESRGEGYVSVETFTDRRPPLVERIKAILDDGYAPCDIMILARSANDGAKAAEALLEFKRGNRESRYRFDVMTQDALRINASPLCGFLLALFHLTADPEDSIRRAIYNRYLKRPFDAPIEAEERQWLQTLKLLPPEEAFERIVLKYRLGDDPDQIAYLQALHEQIIGFTTGRVADIPLFLEWWKEHGEKRSLSVEQSRDTIEITTIHRAKGLEKKVVVIPYCSWSLEPRTSGETASIIWAEAEGALGEAGVVPVKYGKAMAASHFSEAYYRELVYSYVDHVNLLYVALTRAVEQLHVFIPAVRSGIGGYLWNAIRREDDRCAIGGTEGRYTASESGERCEFGLFAPPEPPKAGGKQPERTVRHALLRDYPTGLPAPGMKLPTSGFEERGGEAEFSPRNFGVLMHRLFEEADTRDDLFEAIGRMHEEGLLTEAESGLLRERTERALADGEPHEWFSGSWDRVLRERDIILPDAERAKGLKRRPDRVMIRGRRAVVVDYKFGEKDPASYRRQIALYLDLLREMGYTETEGWLWFVKLGRTERVE